MSDAVAASSDQKAISVRPIRSICQVRRAVRPSAFASFQVHDRLEPYQNKDDRQRFLSRHSREGASRGRLTLIRAVLGNCLSPYAQSNRLEMAHKCP